MVHDNDLGGELAARVAQLEVELERTMSVERRHELAKGVRAIELLIRCLEGRFAPRTPDTAS